MVFPGISVSSTNKTDYHDKTEILLKVALNTITLTQTLNDIRRCWLSCLGPLEFLRQKDLIMCFFYFMKWQPDRKR